MRASPRSTTRATTSTRATAMTSPSTTQSSQSLPLAHPCLTRSTAGRRSVSSTRSRPIWRRSGPCPLAPPTRAAWSTQETIDYLNAAVQAVHDQFPDTPALALGDIGARHGGPLRPHISHQAGRDLDISFYYKDGTRWYAQGTRDNLDFPRLWAFVR